MDDFEKGMRELAKVSIADVRKNAEEAQYKQKEYERVNASNLSKYQQLTATSSDRMLDGLQKAHEEHISRLRGQIGRLSTYIDRIVGIQPEDTSAPSAGTKAHPNGKLSELFALNIDLDLELRRLTAEVERLDVI